MASYNRHTIISGLEEESRTKLNVLYGPCNSGKTEVMLRYIKNNGKTIWVVNKRRLIDLKSKTNDDRRNLSKSFNSEYNIVTCTKYNKDFCYVEQIKSVDLFIVTIDVFEKISDRLTAADFDRIIFYDDEKIHMFPGKYSWIITNCKKEYDIPIKLVELNVSDEPLAPYTIINVGKVRLIHDDNIQTIDACSFPDYAREIILNSYSKKGESFKKSMEKINSDICWCCEKHIEDFKLVSVNDFNVYCYDCGEKIHNTPYVLIQLKRKPFPTFKRIFDKILKDGKVAIYTEGYLLKNSIEHIVKDHNCSSSNIEKFNSGESRCYIMDIDIKRNPKLSNVNSLIIWKGCVNKFEELMNFLNYPGKKDPIKIYVLDD